ncbi:MAG: septal ring lytic transglycosylase RlpA family protein [Candidatus Omnitrophica bacterium]|nr:septal ring lytic transglycosylase RlpA family protein [Candidatus Omnitrophota bacterium]MCF7894264.1 septal ring lytic transglycosylase RlpA family protein [Candidatus Omnitrophota bacterium]
MVFFAFCYGAISFYHNYSKTGLASYYFNQFKGKKTASGELYRPNKLTAAHRSLAFGTEVEVTNLENNKKVVVTINDRGPYVWGRIIDLSYAAAKKLGILEKGITKVKIRVLEKARNKQ